MIKNILIITLFIFSVNLTAQKLPVYGHYNYNGFVYNPANSGMNGRGVISFAHRQQWIKTQGAPSTSLIGYDNINRTKKIAYSGYLYNDKTGILNRLGLHGNFAYKLNLTKDIGLSFGVSLGVLNLDFNINRVSDAKKNNHPMIKRYSSGKMSIDANIGMVISYSGIELGLSAPQLFANKIEYAKNFKSEQALFNLQRHYIVHLKVKIPLTKKTNKYLGDINITPFAIVKYVPNEIPQYETNTLLSLSKIGWLGAGYNSMDGITANIGLNITEQFSIGYIYDISLDKTLINLGNSHEISLIYKFQKVKKNRKTEKSVAEELRNQMKELKNKSLKQEVDSLDQQKDSILNRIQIHKDSIYDLGKRSHSNYKNNDDKQIVTKKTPKISKKDTIQLHKNSPLNRTRFKPNSSVSNADLFKYPSKETISNSLSKGIPASKIYKPKTGYYIVVGVFSQKQNAINLYKNIKRRKIDVSYFFDSKKKYYYVFLMKFDNEEDAKIVKRSKMGGKYKGKLWVYKF